MPTDASSASSRLSRLLFTDPELLGAELGAPAALCFAGRVDALLAGAVVAGVERECCAGLGFGFGFGFGFGAATSAAGGDCFFSDLAVLLVNELAPAAAAAGTGVCLATGRVFAALAAGFDVVGLGLPAFTSDLLAESTNLAAEREFGARDDPDRGVTILLLALRSPAFAAPFFFF